MKELRNVLRRGWIKIQTTSASLANVISDRKVVNTRREVSRLRRRLERAKRASLGRVLYKFEIYYEDMKHRYEEGRKKRK